MNKIFKIGLIVFVVAGFSASSVIMFIQSLKWFSYVSFPIIGAAYLYLFLGEDIKKGIKDKLLYQNTYKAFYEGFEKENGKLKSFNKFVRYVEYALIVGFLSLVAYLIYDLTTTNMARLQIIKSLCSIIVLSGLAIHFHDVNKLLAAIALKNEDKVSDSAKNSRIKIFRLIGRYSHLTAFFAIVVYLILLMIDKPIFLTMLPIIPFWFYFTIYTGYGALYAAMADYVTGEKRQFNCQS